MVSPADAAMSQEPLSDEEVVVRVLAGETAMFEIVMRRHNQRLYRVAWAILRDDGEADAYRLIFMLRDVEEISTTDAANILEITEENVKVRLHRARALLREGLYARAGIERQEAFNFHAVRCDRVVKNVFERIQKEILKPKESEAGGR